ncbi:MAG: membrane protein insertase YidC [Chloroflexi bacterium]|nr:membrane protein insertase YidC [Chloroflexota bacterium]MDL1885495.1 YidC/Oxa1 family membrane protein insertase [Anaerolineae bacterium CFX8]
MWDLILNPFVTVITVLYSIFGNVVVAIIIFTILVRLLMYPLNIQQMRSSKAMQALQPELKKLQEKYKNDREKLAQEQMALYRQHGINPLGGCLPLLIQFPIWIGLYQAINHALAATPLQLIDLGGRFLVGGLDHLVPLNNVWLGMDLTQPPTPPTNPVFALALPLLVLVTTWVQSKLITPPTPSGEDGQPNQAAAMTQSMTTIMPIMMGFFSLSFSVGLSIYFVVSNLFTIAQYSLQGQADWRRLLRLKKPDGEGADTVSGTARPKKPADSPARPEKKAADKTTQPKSKTQRAKPAK